MAGSNNQRQVSVTVCTSSYEYNIKGLMDQLKNLQTHPHQVIKKVSYHQLPYNNIDKHKFIKEQHVDVMILCHSITNRRLAITDVPDACYDKFLPNCTELLGKEKIVVIAHDFMDMSEKEYQARMVTLRHQQPKTFRNSGLVMISGKLDEGKRLRGQDEAQLLEFLKMATQQPEKREQGFISSIKKNLSSMDSSHLCRKRPAQPGVVQYRGQEHPVTINQPAKLPPRSHGQGEQSPYPMQQSQRHPSPSSVQQPGHLTQYSKQPVQQPVGKHNVGQHHGQTAEHDHGQIAGPRLPQTPAQQTGINPAQLSGKQEQNPAECSPHQHGKTIGQRSSQLPSGHQPHDPPQYTPQQPPQYHPQQHAASSHQRPVPQSRQINVSICTSSDEFNIGGLVARLNELKTDSAPFIADIRFRRLPYNDIDSFKFPSNDPVDVMVLCHSVNNRGFEITDVTNSIYDKFLKYCNKEIGKEKLALIVHDISGWSPGVARNRMDYFQETQPSTFKFAHTVLICGNLQKSEDLEISNVDMIKLLSFFETASLEPRKKASTFDIIKRKCLSPKEC
ncbi:uncharacterized protein LOC121423376 [Lytechinus variegatus]|uniref:uncharacterized protein LOC121423376 n=1 Tax=Lytechinus variegatus TaxID=7654 RepID=UPI001BB1B6DE|nr:uncharacterized protein LOC121423376 [Lytechinus variegatus]